MANNRPKPEEIINKLRQVEVSMGQVMFRLDTIRQIGVAGQAVPSDLTSLKREGLLCSIF